MALQLELPRFHYGDAFNNLVLRHECVDFAPAFSDFKQSRILSQSRQGVQRSLPVREAVVHTFIEARLEAGRNAIYEQCTPCIP
jgi:hypothetical protein